MSASIWAPGNNLVTLDAESTNLSQVFTATDSQVIFNLTLFSYAVGTGSIAVYRGGQRIILGTDWAETSSTSISLIGFTIAAGEIIEVVAVLGSASTSSIAAAASAASAAASAAAAQVGTVAGDLVFTGSGKRITGDFSNATVANRVMFQTSAVNTATEICAVPSGSGQQSSIVLLGKSTAANCSILRGLVFDGSEVSLRSTIDGVGTYVPMTFYTGGTERMRIDEAGTVLVKSAAGLGYGAGAGGTVTQATSKSTSVTLNKPCGQITMNAAALAAGATVQFTVNNSLVTSTDVPFALSNWSGNYSARVISVGVGSFTIALKNETGGSLSDAVVINFAIIKGETA